MDLNTVKSIYRSTADYANKEVTLGGWIRTMRVSKNFGFIELNDGSFFKNIQIVFEADNLSNYAEITKLGVGAAIIVKGLLQINFLVIFIQHLDIQRQALQLFN